MIKPQTLKGFRDFLPNEARKRQYVLSILKKVFEKYGFEPLETPVLEYEEILAGKYGEEGEKLMYRFEDLGGRKVAMRYDQTVPLARVVAQYENQITFPFKRYQIQPVWRAENTQKGRFREFLQCDADIVGTSSPLADAELITMATKVLKELGFQSLKVLINDRQIFPQLNKQGFIKNGELVTVLRSLDKIKKIGEEGVLDELQKKGFPANVAQAIIKNAKVMQKSDRLVNIFNALNKINSDQNIFLFEPILARGLDYYTSTIFEIEIEEYAVGSVCGGGRYDNLIGMFSDQTIPAVGFSFGFDRIIDAMEELNLFPPEINHSSTQILVTIFSEELKNKSLAISNELRNNNIKTEIYLGEIKEKNPLEKQLKYADQKGIAKVIIIGPEEAGKNIVTLKNMKSREQKQISIEDAIKLLKP